MIEINSSSDKQLAIEIKNHLEETRQAFCFDHHGIIWDLKKCEGVINA
jgi:hypothetical protein